MIGAVFDSKAVVRPERISYCTGPLEHKDGPNAGMDRTACAACVVCGIAGEELDPAHSIKRLVGQKLRRDIQLREAVPAGRRFSIGRH